MPFLPKDMRALSEEEEEEEEEEQTKWGQLLCLHHSGHTGWQGARQGAAVVPQGRGGPKRVACEEARALVERSGNFEDYVV